MSKLYVSDKETGTFIEEVKSIEHGLSLIKEYEENDKLNNVFEQGFYDIVNEEHCTVL